MFEHTHSEKKVCLALDRMFVFLQGQSLPIRFFLICYAQNVMLTKGGYPPIKNATKTFITIVFIKCIHPLAHLHPVKENLHPT